MLLREAGSAVSQSVEALRRLVRDSQLLSDSSSVNEALVARALVFMVRTAEGCPPTPLSLLPWKGNEEISRPGFPAWNGRHFAAAISEVVSQPSSPSREI